MPMALASPDEVFRGHLPLPPQPAVYSRCQTSLHAHFSSPHGYRLAGVRRKLPWERL